MNKYLKLSFKGLLILTGLFFTAYLMLVWYVSANKESIIKQATTAIGNQINGHVNIEGVELTFFKTFPKVSVFLHNVTVTDSLYSRHHHAFFMGEEVFAQLSISKVIKKEFSIRGIKIINASIYLFTDSAGYSNKYLFKQKTTNGNQNFNATSELKKVTFKNVHLTIDDQQKNKRFDFFVKRLNTKLNASPTALLISSKLDLLVNECAFNREKGSFAKGQEVVGDFALKYIKNDKRLEAKMIEISFNGHPFIISALFNFKEPGQNFKLNLATKNILYSSIKSLLPNKISTALSIVGIDKEVDAKANISGPLKKGDPLIEINCAVKNAHLKTPFFDFENATFSGYYTNETNKTLPRKDPNSKITLKQFSSTWHGLAITAESIELQNLSKPVLTTTLHASFGLKALNNIISNNHIVLKSGKGNAHLSYSGPIVRNNHTSSFINGEISFSDGTVLYAPRSVEMKMVNGKLVFKNSDVLVKNIQCVVLGNKITMNGRADNLLTLMNREANKIRMNWNIYSPSLNLLPFTYLLKPQKLIKKEDKKTQGLKMVSKNIDAILEQASLTVSLKADRLQYKKFVSTNVEAQLLLLPESYEIKQVKMNHSGGSLQLKGALVNKKSNYHQVSFYASLENVDVAKIFEQFNNFGQEGIEAKNLKGKLSAKVKGSFGLNNEGKAYPGSIVSTIDFSLKHGELIDYEPIKKIQQFIFKKRDFDNIRFAELKDRLEIAHEEIKINRMEIASSVFTVFLEGVYSLNGKSDLSIQIPLSNLKKKKVGSNPKNRGIHEKAGTSIYLRGQPGKDGDIQFKVDLFNRYNKSNEKD